MQPALNEDDAVQQALDRCIAPLQALPYAERAVLFIDPSQTWALFLIRQKEELFALSTYHHAPYRRVGRLPYNIDELESSLTSPACQTLQQVADRLTIKGLEPINECGALPFDEALENAAGSFLSLEWQATFGHALGVKQLNNFARRTEAYFVNVLKEHMGVEYADTRVSYQGYPEARRPAQGFDLKPLRTASLYLRRQKQISLDAMPV